MMGGLLLRMTFCDGIRILSDGIDDGTACDEARSWIDIVCGTWLVCIGHCWVWVNGRHVDYGEEDIKRLLCE